MTKSQKDPRETFSVSFMIEGACLDLEAITRGITTPSYTHRAGELSKIKTPFRNDMWCLTSSLKPKNEPFDAHLKWLHKKLKPSYAFIRSLKDIAEVYIRFGYVTEREQCGFSLSPEALTIFAELVIPLDVSIMCL